MSSMDDDDCTKIHQAFVPVAAEPDKQSPSFLVVSGPASAGKMFKLKGEMIIGRTTQAEIYLADAHFPKVRDTVMGRCSMCHAEEPVQEGIYHAPKGVMLDTDARIAEHAREIYLQAGRSHAMPPANLTHVTDEERRLIVAWFEGAGE